MHGPGPPLEVKVLPPSLPPRALSRPRVEATIADALGHRLTTIVAGAGFGKTTALVQLAADRPVAWYTVSPDDRDPLTFAAGLVDALRLRAPTLELLLPQGQGQTSDDRATEDRAVAAAAALAAAVQVAAPSSLALVIDDVHELEAGSGGAALLDALVRQLPERVSVVLAGRDGPPFATSRLRTRGQAVDVGATELAFDLDETVELLASALGDEDVGALAAELHARTGGWPAAVCLAADLLRTESGRPAADAVARVLGRQGPIAGPLVAEVLDRDPEPVVATLGRLAYLDRFTPELAEVVAGPEAPAVITRIAPRGVYLVALGGPWWAVHPMMREELRARVPRPDRERLRAAAAWSADHGRIADSLGLLAAADDQEAVAETLERFGASAVAAGQAATVVAAAEGLSPELRSPEIEAVDGQARQTIGDWEGALERLGRVTPAEGPIPAAIAWRLGLIHHFRGELDEALTIYARGGGGETRDRALHAAWHAAAHWLVGDRDRSAALATEAEGLARASSDRQALAAAHTALALVAALDGDRAANDAHYLRALDHATAAGDLLQVVRIRANRGSRSMEEGRYEEALSELDEAVRLAEITGFASFGALALGNRAEVLIHLGRLDEARRDLASAITAEQSIGSRMIAYALGHLGDVHRIRGDNAQARAAYEEAIATARVVGDLQGYLPAMASLARLLADTGELDEASATIEEALAAPVSLARARVLIAAAAVALARHDLPAAERHGREAATVARERRDRAALAEALEMIAAAGGATAEADLDEARAIYAELGEPLGLARIDLALARVAPLDEARRLASSAQRVFQRLGARTLAAAAGARLSELDRLATPPLAVRALGEFSVQRMGEAIPRTAWQSRKARDLVKVLLVRRGRPVHREELMALLWPDEDASKASARLSVALSTARGVFDPDKEWSPDHVISSDGSTLQLRREHVWIDIEGFLDAADSALRAHREGREGAVEGLAFADSLYTGELLEEDRYEDWPVALREEVRNRYLEVTRALGDHAEANSDYDGAVRVRLRLLELDPYDENAHLALARVLAEAGRHGEARRAHSTYCTRMAELGIEPAPFPSPLTPPR